MRFRIGELDAWIEGAPEHRPVVVITSNSEKSLPEPFLRRCVFHHIKSPDDARRREIVARRCHPFVRREAAFEEAMRLFDRLHDRLGRPPGTAELLAWLTALEDEAKRAELRQAAGTPLTSLKGILEPSLGTLAKTKEDLDRAREVVEMESLG
jgi:MoxR-like ATPase